MEFSLDILILYIFQHWYTYVICNKLKSFTFGVRNRDDNSTRRKSELNFYLQTFDFSPFDSPGANSKSREEPHCGPENLKKSRPKKLVKSNKSISRKFFWPNSNFCNFKNDQKSIFELGKSLKLPKMQFQKKKFFLIDLISRGF